jgi:hypothetical protein
MTVRVSLWATPAAIAIGLKISALEASALAEARNSR